MCAITLRDSSATDPLLDMISQLEDEIKIAQERMLPYEKHIAYNQNLIARLKAAAAVTATQNEDSLAQ